jgi:hypothetical protein
VECLEADAARDGWTQHHAALLVLRIVQRVPVPRTCSMILFSLLLKLRASRVGAKVSTNVTTIALAPNRFWFMVSSFFAGPVLRNERELDGQLVASAQALRAKAVFTMTLTPATFSAGSGVELGNGGFSFGHGGGGGVGLRVPVGCGGWATGLAASARVTEVSSNRLVWTATLMAAPSANLNAQFSELSRAMPDPAWRAGVF